MVISTACCTRRVLPPSGAEAAAIREQTRSPIVLVAATKGRGSSTRRSIRHRRRPAPAAARGERRLHDQEGCSRQACGADGKPRAVRSRGHGLLPEGRHRQDGHRREPRRSAREARPEADASARPRSPVRRRCDRHGDRAREDDLRSRRRTGRAGLRQAHRLHDEASLRSRHPRRTATPGGCGARHRVEDHAPARGRQRVVRRDRRRHLPVLPRADAGDARPHRRALVLCAASTCRR